MQFPVGGGEAFDGDDLPVSHGVREDRAGVERNVVDEDGTGAAFGAVASELRAGEPELVAKGPGEGFLLHDVDAARLAVDVDGNEAFAGTASSLSEEIRGSEQIVRRRYGDSAADHSLDEVAAGEALVG